MKSVTVRPVVILLNECFVCSLFSLGLFHIVAPLPSGNVEAWLYTHLGPFMMLWCTPPTTINEWSLWVVVTAVIIICIPAYLIRPNGLTSTISLLGIAGWFFSGLHLIMMLGHGA